MAGSEYCCWPLDAQTAAQLASDTATMASASCRGELAALVNLNIVSSSSRFGGPFRTECRQDTHTQTRTASWRCSSRASRRGVFLLRKHKIRPNRVSSRKNCVCRNLVCAFCKCCRKGLAHLTSCRLDKVALQGRDSCRRRWHTREQKPLQSEGSRRLSRRRETAEQEIVRTRFERTIFNRPSRLASHRARAASAAHVAQAAGRGCFGCANQIAR